MAGKPPATVLEAGTTVEGQLSGAEDVVVLGILRGEVVLEGALTVEEGARVEADAQLESLLVAGIFVGKASASVSIELAATARVVGDLDAPRIIVAEGAACSGFIEVRAPAAPRSPAPRSPAPRSAPPRSPAPRSAPPRSPAPRSTPPRSAPKPSPQPSPLPAEPSTAPAPTEESPPPKASRARSRSKKTSSARKKK